MVWNRFLISFRNVKALERSKSWERRAENARNPPGLEGLWLPALAGLAGCDTGAGPAPLRLSGEILLQHFQSSGAPGKFHWQLEWSLHHPPTAPREKLGKAKDFTPKLTIHRRGRSQPVVGVGMG